MTIARPAPTVVALGGHAISPGGGRDDIARQFAHTRRTAGVLVDLFGGAPLVVTHGNGPQVGAAMRRVELAGDQVYALPLDVLVADLQGGMGYMIALCLANERRQRGAPASVVTLVTTVEVDRTDPAFESPSKPVGAGSNRRLVPSPRPRAIIEIDAIRRLLECGTTLVTLGGGGVPVARDDTGDLAGIEAVVDKDHASGLLAIEIGARDLVILTPVAHVCADFGTPAERALARLTVREAIAHRDRGQFPAGSMGPKIDAAIAFLAPADNRGSGGAGGERPAPTARPKRVIITDVAHLAEALAGRAGTTIVPDR